MGNANPPINIEIFFFMIPKQAVITPTGIVAQTNTVIINQKNISSLLSPILNFQFTIWFSFEKSKRIISKQHLLSAWFFIVVFLLTMAAHLLHQGVSKK
jgi:hypothetical protein